MSDLTNFRDHCAQMAEAEHKETCGRATRLASDDRVRGWKLRSCASTEPHDPHEWAHESFEDLTWHCPGLCGGCNPVTDRELWARLAAEIDAYLAGHGDEPLEGL